jgi:leucyl aminopeptidase
LKTAFFPHFDTREPADLLIVPFWENQQETVAGGHCKEAMAPLWSSKDFSGKSEESALLYWKGEKEPRLLALGLGKAEDATPESLRRLFAQAVRTALAKKAKHLNVVFPTLDRLKKETLFASIYEGMLLANYAFNKLKSASLKDHPEVLLEKLGCVSVAKEVIAERIETIVGGVCYVRDLVNGNADDVDPRMLANEAMALEKISPQIKTAIFDKKWLEKEGMGLLLAVNRASSREPFLIQTAYQGNPHSKEHIVLVGKGITYDTGGLSLKPTEAMLSMKCDMAGAATVLGTVRTAALLGLKVNVTAVAPVTENCIGSKSYKLGDVYRSYTGKTVEINNTDAEGRLVLADALGYALKHLHPTCLIDLATLTGAIIIALGEEMAGLFSNHDPLAQDLMEASRHTDELLWKMPLNQDYKSRLKSDVADLINSPGREAGSMTAALFLQEFVTSAPWAHIDIAGPAYFNKPKYYHPTKATGYGVRLLIDFLSKKESSQ